MVQKSILYALFFTVGIVSFTSNAAEETPPEGGTLKTFVVSAYYSPLPEQEAYVRGSYEADMILNGRGTHGADGTPVYPGMLAAPKSYAFGTRIYIPGLGIGTVHDRGGAIVEKENYHRIDVWMGHGDAGRIKALNWGMRQIQGYVYASLSEEDSIETATITAPKAPHVPATPTFTNSISYGSKGKKVKELQKNLKEIGIYNGAISGYFGDQTKEAVITFQIQHGVIVSKTSVGSGYVGPKTRAALNAIAHQQKQLYAAQKIPPEKLLFPQGMYLGKEGDNIKRLQIMLRELEYLEAEPTGYFGYQTQSALMEFQKDHNVIASHTEKGAGYFGPKTQLAFIKVMKERNKKTQNNIPPKILHISGDPIPQKKRHAITVQNPPAPPLNRSFSAPLAYGSRGEAVKAVQEKLIEKGYLAAGLNTGFYGKKTTAAVEAFQEDELLASAPKGVVEQKTFAKIWS